MAKERYISRHNGPRTAELEQMLKKIKANSVEDMISKVIPDSIRLKNELNIDEGISEYQYLKKIKDIASKNKVFKSYIGQGYYGTITPSVIIRNILENPSWYTSYTPYQAEISQGRLEALLNFQTVVMELTGMDLANASLLDEATAAAEAMIMMYNNRSRKAKKAGANKFLVHKNIFPQTLDVLKTRAHFLGIELEIKDHTEFNFDEKVFGAIVQYPDARGEIEDFKELTEKAHKNESLIAVAADILSLAILTPPGEWGADIVFGSTQRFGIPMGYGGPHAAYFATSEKYKRKTPGRIIGVSVDKQGNQALRMALQTREQHIKRERATSNICTAQALLATMAGMYAVYHGKEGLVKIAEDIHHKTITLKNELKNSGYKVLNKNFFDSLQIQINDNIKIEDIRKAAVNKEINLYYADEKTIGVSIDETCCNEDLAELINIFKNAAGKKEEKQYKIDSSSYSFDDKYIRKSDFLTLDVFKKYKSETEMMRYIKRLERKDFSLTHSMIPLGSCTMKLNPATGMFPITWPEFSNIHPFVPKEQAEGYYILFDELKKDLCEITGFSDISLQPNSGAAGEYTGLAVIRAYQESKGEADRNIVLIPSSAHGTNPASGIMAGMEVVVVDCDENGNIDLQDLKKKAEENKDKLSAFMVTYPSTHGVFESKIIEMNKIIHDNGGQVYLDGANMNAQIGYTNPQIVGADVCHLNLHKTFAIPHGGGGPGVGPIGVASHLVDFLPTHPVIKTGGKNGIHAIAAAPFGSAGVLPISHAYIKMAGKTGLKEATDQAIMNANYIAFSLNDKFDILYTGENGYAAHEMILDCRPFKKDTPITEADIAKRLMDYGFHAPTLSFPVHGTLMVEPTESESLQELNKFIEAMRTIHDEIEEIKNNKADVNDNVLVNAPHTAVVAASDEWKHNYSRTKAVFPLPWVVENKFYPAVGRIDDGYGDRNLVCSCAPIDEYRKKTETVEIKI